MTAKIIPTNVSPDRLTTSIVYAIGDIHGRLDLLEILLSELRVEADNAPSGERITAIFLGDYIDRGPDSCGVVSRLIALRDEHFCNTVFLRGNHEHLMIEIIDERSKSMTWLQHGGAQTLRSYGAEIGSSPVAARTARIPSLLRSLVPAQHLDFLRQTELLYEWGDYVFVHAGLRADRLLEEQSDLDLLCSRHADEGRPVHGKIVVHGHTPCPRPVNGRWRIAIDTEAYASGALTVLKLYENRRQFFRIYSPRQGRTPEMSEWNLNEPQNQSPPQTTSSSLSMRWAAKPSSGFD